MLEHFNQLPFVKMLGVVQQTALQIQHQPEKGGGDNFVTAALQLIKNVLCQLVLEPNVRETKLNATILHSLSLPCSVSVDCP